MRWMALAALLALVLSATKAGEPSLDEVLRRVAAYVDSFGDRASILVGTEQYEQQVTGNAPRDAQRRVIIADVALVWAAAQRRWLTFRDVIAVDGTPISDRQDRLVQVLEQSKGRLDEARRLNDESARFNIGAIGRNFNVPTTALFFFSPLDRHRFQFTRVSVEPGGGWRIRFKETVRPSLIRTPSGGSIPAEGEFVADPATGCIRETVLRLYDLRAFGSPHLTGRVEVDVIYALVPEMGMWLPARMEESYYERAPLAWTQVSGRATYSNYRKFQTSARIK